MPETKTTPRKRATCPNCKKDIKVEEYLKHIKTCGNATQSKTKPAKTIACTVCNTLFSKNSYLNKHKKKFHPVAATTTPTSVCSEDSLQASNDAQEDQADEWDRDPDIELDYYVSESEEEEQHGEKSEAVELEDNELTLGRIERKPTTPDPVKAPIKRKEIEVVTETQPIKETKKKQISIDPEISGVSKVRKAVQCTTENLMQVSILKCDHCKIHFEDDVLFTIHRRWHSLSDPFLCNMCGEQCVNSHGFYSHLGRYHTK